MKRKNIYVVATMVAALVLGMTSMAAAQNWDENDEDVIAESNELTVEVEDGRDADISLQVWNGTNWKSGSVTVKEGEPMTARVKVTSTGSVPLENWALGVEVDGINDVSQVSVESEGIDLLDNSENGTTEFGVDGGSLYIEGGEESASVDPGETHQQDFEVTFNETGTFTGQAFVLDEAA